MSRNEFRSIKINGVSYEGNVLLDHCKKKLSQESIQEWEQHIFAFIIELISDSNFITVQTSGSTGKPKTIKLSKDVLIQSAKLTEKFLNLKTDMSALLCLSAEYIAGKMMIVRAFISGLNLICVEPNGNPLNNTKYKIDIAAMIPLQVANSLKSEKEKLKIIGKLIIGGGRIDSKLQQKIINFPNKIYASFGMTETATHIALKKLNTQNPDEHYKCVDGIKIYTSDAQCLQIDAPHISNQVIKTNDIVSVFSETEFEIIGRMDNIINTGGIKISPEELEEKISSFIEKNILVTSLPDEKLGEKIILLIENGRTNLNLLYNLWVELDKHLEKHEIPKQIDFMSAFKYTKSGKIDRSLTKEFYLKK